MSIPPQFAAAQEKAILQSTGVNWGSYLDLIGLGICAQLLVFYVRKPVPTAEKLIIYAASAVALIATIAHLTHLESLRVLWGDASRISDFHWEKPAAFTFNAVSFAFTELVVFYYISKYYGLKLVSNVLLAIVWMFVMAFNNAITGLSLQRPRSYTPSDPALKKWVKDFRWVLLTMHVFNLLSFLICSVGCLYAWSKDRTHRRTTGGICGAFLRYLNLVLRSFILPVLFGIVTIILSEVYPTSNHFFVTFYPLNKLVLWSFFLARNKIPFPAVPHDAPDHASNAGSSGDDDMRKAHPNDAHVV